MSSDMLTHIEEILKITDEVKTKLEERGLKPQIKIESSMEKFDFDFKISATLEY